MKANATHTWWIKLSGKTQCKRAVFTGTVDEALAEADVMESQVRWVVYAFELKRVCPASQKPVTASS